MMRVSVLDDLTCHWTLVCVFVAVSHTRCIIKQNGTWLILAPSDLTCNYTLEKKWFMKSQLDHG